MKIIRLPLKDRSYAIVIGRNLLSSTAKLIRPLGLGKKIFIVTNQRIKRLGFLTPVLRPLRASGYEITVHTLKHGNEKDKSPESLLGLWRHMARSRLERSSAVLALGGGVVGDVAGFAAATYMRGISIVQVPTTLLAQVDAAVGGKTGVDLAEAKNIVGAFHQPRLVVVDVNTLSRMGLTPSGLREMKNSFAEIIKYGIIQDLSLFRLLEQNVEAFLKSARKKPLGMKELSFLEAVIARSVRVKARVVAGDERETKGRRMILNYGHTFGHAFEAASNYRIPHGEAVALGMVCAARLAESRGMFSAHAERRQNLLIQKAGLPTRLPVLKLKRRRVISSMLLDKKRKGGRLRFVLPAALGRVKVVSDVTAEEIKKVLEGK